MSASAPPRIPALSAIGRDIGVRVAAPHAEDVDRNARFPIEAIDALRAAGALAAGIPTAFGGPGHPLGDIARTCFELGRSCASTGMIFAMHQVQVLTLARHAEPGGRIAAHLERIAAEQRLVASVTSEIGTGGDLGRSMAPVIRRPGGVSFEKRAPTVSYGATADDFLVTLRRAPESEPGDQVAVLISRDQVQLEPAGEWDTFGMRGTCSPGFTVRGRCDSAQVLPVPFSQVAAVSMTPLSHVLWSHVWLGIATDAFDRARECVRTATRRDPDQARTAALRLSQLSCELSPMRSVVAAGLADLEAVPEGDPSSLETLASALRFNTLKLVASTQAPDICRGAMEVCGISGYRNDTAFSIGRHLRDAMSASLMIANDRIHTTDAGLLLVAKEV